MLKESQIRKTTNRKRTTIKKIKERKRRRRGNAISTQRRGTTLKIVLRKRSLKNFKRSQMGRL